MIMRIRKTKTAGILASAALALVLAACKTPKDMVYLEDIVENVSVTMQMEKKIKLQPGDKLNIIVHSRDQDLAEMFNQVNTRNTGGGNGYSYYTVDTGGKIDMPVLGLLGVEGLTRMEVAALIKYRLLSSKLLRDPTVTVEYADMGYFVMGEVNNPGRYDIDRDRITMLEGLAMAGDLTINGRRDNILVLRTADGKQTPHRVNITQTDNLYGSPVYYLQQNDVIYVEPNAMRLNQSKLNANTMRTPTFWMSASSFLLTLVTLFTSLL